MTTYCSVVLGGGQGGRVRGSGLWWRLRRKYKWGNALRWWVMRYPSIVIPSEVRNLYHSQSGTRAFPHMCRAVPLSSAVFHSACALSAPSGHLPLEGKAAMRGKPASKRLSGIAIIYTFRRFYILMRRTAISHFSFLISHSSKAFIPSQGGSTPHRLALNLEP